MALLIPLVEIVHVEEVSGRGIKRLHVLLVHVSLRADIRQNHIAEIVVRGEDGGVVLVITEVARI